MKILANDGIDPLGKSLLEKAGFTVDTEHIPQDQLAEKLPAYDAITVRSATKVRKELIDGCPDLKLIGRGGVGMDNIDVAYARSKGIAVVNTPAASSLSVAELVFAHLLSGVRFLYDSQRKMPVEGDTNFGGLKKAYAKGVELRGKTLGIVGIGRIGRETAKVGLGLGMDVIVSDLSEAPASLPVTLSGGITVDVPIKQVPLEELLRNSDFISLHVPFTDKPVIGAAEFELLKPGVGLVNAARGGVIDEEALIAALNAGKVAFAGLDVFDNEPTPRKELLTHPKVSLTPHIGAATGEAQERIGEELANLIIAQLTK
ncbi:D-2-hydroxyacid dehydrogenase [Parapedobacter lycopersici]|uniref:D-2-hydroxyacid dehydrogenase n=1 Tax=Parapedobacter lycopersici TaxID=1864939 RepID=UPI00214D76FA|nr:D-2-hydroxyacid dehydrogenase [Parapedobacter lycopersici]